MQVYIIITVALVYIADETGLVDSDWPLFINLKPINAILLGLAIFLAISLISSLTLKYLYTKINKTGSNRALNLSELVLKLTTIVSLLAHANNIFVLNWVKNIRLLIAGDWILIDELLNFAPPLLILIIMWWAFYPIQNRLREALLIRQLDEGSTIYPYWSRFQYVFSHIRMHFVLLLLPILIILTWSELIEKYWPQESPIPYLSRETAEYCALLTGILLIFIFAPLMVRYLWDTKPLAPSELRNKLTAMCQTHRIKIRQILVWNTNGGLINAAVMGLLPMVRYVLLSDALLDSLEDKEIEAVMAHELGHVRRRHLQWLAIILIALFTVTGTATSYATIYYHNNYMINNNNNNNHANNLNNSNSQLTPKQAIQQIFQWFSSNNQNQNPQQSQQQQLQQQLQPSSSAFNNNHNNINPSSIPNANQLILEMLSFIVSLTLTLIIFGWISRRFERQADTFAVQHLSGLTRNPNNNNNQNNQLVITPDAVQSMCRALEIVAVKSNIPTNKKSWRHGSIIFRQNYLQTLTNKPCTNLPIDKLIKWLKKLTIITLILTITLTWYLSN